MRRTEDRIENLSVVRIVGQKKKEAKDAVIREIPLTIFLNNKELITLLCTPENLKYLAVGFLSSEGFIKNRKDIKKLVLDEEKGMAWIEVKENKDFVKKLMFKRLITSGCGKGTTFYSAVDAAVSKKIDSKKNISFQQVTNLVNRIQQSSLLYRSTGGVHSAALCNEEDILIFSEDIGRHNAIDKIFGECILKDIPTEDKIVITSGRVSSEILLKVAKKNIPIIISRSAPTNLAVKLATKLGVTVIGFARGKRMNIYANDWRVSSN